MEGLGRMIELASMRIENASRDQAIENLCRLEQEEILKSLSLIEDEQEKEEALRLEERQLALLIILDKIEDSGVISLDELTVFVEGSDLHLHFVSGSTLSDLLRMWESTGILEVSVVYKNVTWIGER